MCFIKQNNITTLTPEMLRKCPQPPVPFLGQQAPVPPPQPVNTSGVAQLPLQNNISENSGISSVPSISNQGSQPPFTVENPVIDGTGSTVVNPHTSGNPAVMAIHPLSSQELSGVGISVGATKASQKAEDDFADFQEAPIPAAAGIKYYWFYTVYV